MRRFLGRCCVSTNYNVKYVDGDGATVWTLDALDAALLVHCLAVAPDASALYVGTWKHDATGFNTAWPMLARYDLDGVNPPTLAWQKTLGELRTIGLGYADTGKIQALAVDSGGNVIVGTGNGLLKFDGDGGFLWKQLGARLYNVHSLAIDGSDNIFCGLAADGGTTAGTAFNLIRVTSAGTVNWTVSWNDAHQRVNRSYPGYFFSGTGNLTINDKTTLRLLHDGTNLYAGSFCNTSEASYVAISKLLPGGSGGTLHVWTYPPGTDRRAVDLGSVMGLWLTVDSNVATAHFGSDPANTLHREVLQIRNPAGAKLVGKVDPDNPTATAASRGGCSEPGGTGKAFVLLGNQIQKWDEGVLPLVTWGVDWTETAVSPGTPRCIVAHPTDGALIGGDFTS